MADFFTKPLADLTIADVEALAGLAEGMQFEIKGDLSSRQGRDSWHSEPAPMRPRSGPGDRAKREIFEELVAFANTEGGWLVIGVEETGRPGVAGKIAPLPDCRDLAARLRQSAQDLTDPPLPGLLAAGIETGEHDDGVVVMRVPRSPLRPHGLKESGSWRALRRVDHEAKTMHMREVHEMVLERERETDRTEAAFVDARDLYADLPLGAEVMPDALLGFQIVAVPVSSPLSVDRPYLREDLFERQFATRCNISSSNKADLETLDRNYQGPAASGFVPALRSGRHWHHAQMWDGSLSYAIETRITESGTVAITAKIPMDHVRPSIAAEWLLADAANVVRIVERVREASAAPDVPFALELKLGYQSFAPIGAIATTNPFATLPEGLLLDFERLMVASGRPPQPEVARLPRYTIGTAGGFSDVLSTMTNDLLNLCGRPHREGLAFEL